MSDDRTLLDEHVLRRALRLDVDEIPARLDPVLVAAAARMSRPARGQLLGIAAAAFVGGWVWSEALRAVLDGVSGLVDPLGTLIGVATAALIGAGSVADLATYPAVPIAIFTAAVLAALSERRRQHVPAS